MELTVAGQRCRVRTGGLLQVFDPSRPTVVLIHGAANDSDVWHKIAEALSGAGYAVLAPDLPGHGLSGGEASGSIEALAGWIVALLDAAGVRRAILAGHSMGSLIALEAAARHPRRVHKLALLGATVPMPVSDALLDAARHHPDNACRLMAKFSHTSQFYLAGSGGHGVWGPGVTLAIMRRSRRGVLATDLENCNRYLNGISAAARVECPALLVVARRDRMTPGRKLHTLQAALRHAMLAEIADCGHAMMDEQPEKVIAALLGFLVQ
ncbi:MAG: alpha/beta hydrolase [Betaproteobacteria bacterium]|nr:alpha/beta hydrolase [Betaproteobacteria bacterium]